MNNYEFTANNNGSFQIEIGNTIHNYGSQEDNIQKMLQMLLENTEVYKNDSELENIKQAILQNARTKESIRKESNGMTYHYALINGFYSHLDLEATIDTFIKKARSMRLPMAHSGKSTLEPRNNVEKRILLLTKDEKLLQLYRDSKYNSSAMDDNYSVNIIRHVLNSNENTQTTILSIKALVLGLDYQHIKYLSKDDEVFEYIIDKLYNLKLQNDNYKVNQEAIYEYLEVLSIYENDDMFISFEDYLQNKNSYEPDVYNYFNIALMVSKGFRSQILLSGKLKDNRINATESEKEIMKNLLLHNINDSDYGIALDLIQMGYKPAMRKYAFSHIDKVRLCIAKHSNQQDLLEYLSFDERAIIANEAKEKLKLLNTPS